MDGASMGDHLASAKAVYEAELLSRWGQPNGAAESETRELESRLGLKLPAAYLEFLRWMGNHTRGPFAGTDMFIGDIAPNTEYAREFFDEHDLGAFPTDGLCFYSHQGYILGWLRVSADPNPECFFVGETSREIAHGGRFADFIKQSIERACRRA
ncbi:MAG: SMI1/KNR4 family protein [Myxococcota bacterium]